MTRFLTGILITLVIASCNETNPASDDTISTSKEGLEVQLLEKLDPATSGIDYSNVIEQSEEFNVMKYDGLLQGAGVGVLDVNNDGLLDIYFAGNLNSDRLYLNKGNLKFEDITGSAGIPIDKTWSTGISVVDINEDGYDDIYVCKFLHDGMNVRNNQFLINQKDNTFKDLAKELGVNDPGYGIMANFFDYDNDGDLDLYVMNQPPNSRAIKDQLGDLRTAAFTDRLYRNDGRSFTNVTGAAGLTNYNYALSSVAFDYDKDGDTDLYLACDYEEPDALLRNNGDGTFTDIIKTATRHISNFAMGSDMTDLNGDGLLDLYVVDMVAEDSYRQKTNMSGMNPEKFWYLVNNGYHYQYMHNTLQLNNGDNSFSEISNLAGISNTDWSWAPLFIDFDRDGHDDIYVTNGIIKEVRNKDFINWSDDYIIGVGKPSDKDLLYLSKEAPSVKVRNNLFRNNGDLTFSHFENEWGINEDSWSQGACYGDLDNDGDLDLIVNNMNSVADIFINKSSDLGINNYLSIKLAGGPQNSKGINARIEVYANGKLHYQEMTPYRGYMSTNEAIVHFGLGHSTEVDSIFVTWTDGKTTRQGRTKANQVLELAYEDRKRDRVLPKPSFTNTLKSQPINIEYKENEYDDYVKEVLIPHKMSTLGPFVAVGDVNGDNSDDFFLSSSAGECGQLMIYKDGNYTSKPGPWCGDKASEDGGAAFFDADGDGDLDLMVTSGGNEFDEGSEKYYDRLYLNDGKGNFTKFKKFPEFSTSTSSPLALDYDKDGDLDLFIGGRQRPGYYGRPAPSILLRNDGRLNFSDVSDDVLSGQLNGMVTDAIWTNINGRESLVVIGEWMAITILQIEEGVFVDKTEEMGVNGLTGWWNKIAPLDYDGDGDLDLLVGNLGTNMKFKASKEKPFKVYVDDFDDNGTNDIYLGQAFNDGNYYPLRGRQCSSQQMPFIKKEFKDYDAFAKTTFEDILKERTDSNTVLNEASILESIILKNEGGAYTKVTLPNAAQISPIFDVVIMDIDGDGAMESILAGNYHNREVETTRSDASNGLVLDNKNQILQLSKFGANASGDVRAINKLKTTNGNYLLVAPNNGKIRLYKHSTELM